MCWLWDHLGMPFRQRLRPTRAAKLISPNARQSTTTHEKATFDSSSLPIFLQLFICYMGPTTWVGSIHHICHVDAQCCGIKRPNDTKGPKAERYILLTTTTKNIIRFNITCIGNVEILYAPGVKVFFFFFFFSLHYVEHPPEPDLDLGWNLPHTSICPDGLESSA